MVGQDNPEIVVDEARLSSELESYRDWLEENTEKAYPVSYTHLTLPTIYSV